MTTVKKNSPAAAASRNTGITGGLKVTNNAVPRPTVNALPAGWKAKGSTPAAGLKMTKAAIDGMGVGNTKGKIVAPMGFKVDVSKGEAHVSAKLANGKTVTGDFSGQKLTVTGPSGKAIVLEDTTKDFASRSKEFKSEMAGFSKADLKDFEPMGHYSDCGFSGVGTAGKMMSIARSYDEFSGGAHPNNGADVATFDATTGKQVKLSDILSKSQVASVHSQIQKSLPKLEGSASFEFGSDPKYSNESFALTTDAKGKVQITVAWESGVHALGGQNARFVFDAPTDAAFRSKIGL
jgi:hypothetical protein